MILIADGGSTKADWIAIGKNKEEAFRTRTLGLNPAGFETYQKSNPTGNYTPPKAPTSKVATAAGKVANKIPPKYNTM